MSRRFQVVSLLPLHEVEARALRELFAEQKIAPPGVPGSLAGLVRSWRAEDCLRLSAPRPCLEEIAQLDGRETGLGDLNMLKASALFGLRDFTRSREVLARMAGGAGKEGDETKYMRRQCLILEGRAPEVVREIEAQGEKTTNAELWQLAVARFHTYRKKQAAGGK
jgi:hypothetical protein